jgi:hypothetical protein
MKAVSRSNGDCKKKSCPDSFIGLEGLPPQAPNGREMTRLTRKHILMFSVAAALWICNGQISLNNGSLLAQAEADPGVT